MSNFYDKINNNNNYLSNYKSNNSFKVTVVGINDLDSNITEDTIVSEFPLCLIVNGEYLDTFLCSPQNLKELVIGYLCSRNLIISKEDIIEFNIDKNSRLAKVTIQENNLLESKDFFYLNEYEYINSKPIINNSLKITASEISTVMDLNLNTSELFKNTAGVHCISIYSNDKIIVSCEDVARHNAMDKAIGYCILNNIPLDDKTIFVSGRLSFEMIKKAAIVKIPIVVAKSATTSLVIETAHKLNITLVGFVRGKKMNIYTNPHRVLLK